MRHLLQQQRRHHRCAGRGRLCVRLSSALSLRFLLTQPVPMGLPVHMQTARPPEPTTLRHSNTTGRLIVPAAPRSQAEMKAECPICFEPLCSAPVGVFLGADGLRVSQHFFNLEAARSWLESGSGMCPLTRKPIDSVLEVPDMRSNPEGWFKAGKRRRSCHLLQHRSAQACIEAFVPLRSPDTTVRARAAVDINGDGRLSRLEVIECLKAQLPIDAAALDATLAEEDHWMWQQWDVDGSG